MRFEMTSKQTSIRFVAEFDKNSGSLIRDCKVKNLDIDFLRELFNIDPNDLDEVSRDVGYCYDINDKQAKILQPYVSFKMDLDNFDYTFETRGDYSFKDSK